MARYAFQMTRYAFQMVSLIKDGKISRMANPGRVIYRAGSLTLSVRPISVCQVSNPERVTQHKALWPEVPSSTIEASVLPIVPNQPFVKSIGQEWSGIYQKSFFALCRKGMWRGVTLHGNNPFRV